MFSGIVEGLLEIKKVEETRNGRKLTLDLKKLSREIKIGDSVSINGVWLTAIKKEKSLATFEVIPETLKRTNLGELKTGYRANIELSLRLSDRIGGHLVQGHIDGTGKLLKKEKDGEYLKFWIQTDKKITGMLIEKGSVALDGISMTIVDVKTHETGLRPVSNSGRFSVCLIPHTLEVTTLGLKKPGDRINIEIDQVGKWIKKLLGK